MGIRCMTSEVSKREGSRLLRGCVFLGGNSREGERIVFSEAVLHILL